MSEKKQGEGVAAETAAALSGSALRSGPEDGTSPAIADAPAHKAIYFSAMFCGLCCHLEEPCEKCLANTLKSNGLSDDLLPSVRGLSAKSGGRFEYSELYYKLRDLVKSANP